jgi:hypothetical protein
MGRGWEVGGDRRHETTGQNSSFHSLPNVSYDAKTVKRGAEAAGKGRSAAGGLGHETMGENQSFCSQACRTMQGR